MSRQSLRSWQGPAVLSSKPALSLLCSAILLAVIVLVPSPLRDRLWAAGETDRGKTGVPALPGLAQRGPVAPTSSKEPPAPPVVAEVKTPIEDPQKSMVHFYRSLRERAAKRAGTTRVFHFGDSLIDLDFITAPMRKALQREFGDAGHGFVLTAKPWRWYNHLGVRVQSGGDWEHHRLVGGRAYDGRLGLGGAAVETRTRAWSRVTLASPRRASRIEVHYLKQPRGGTLKLQVDGKHAGEINTAAERKASGFLALRVADTAHSVSLRARGKVRLFGVVFEREGPGVTWENLPMLSARFNQLALLDADHFKIQLTHRPPKLVVFQYGANDTISFGGNIERYGRKILVTLGRVRKALPESSCLVIGPFDRLQRDARGKLHSPAIVQTVLRKQREIAFSAGCAFWDGQHAMGGRGSMKSWARRGLVLKDGVHLNLRGSNAMGALLLAAVKAGYAKSRQIEMRRE